MIDLDQDARTHIEWMMDNRPELVRSLRPRQLWEVVERKLLQAGKGGGED